MLDGLSEIERWLTRPSEREDLFKRFPTDLTPLMMLYGVKDLSPERMKSLRDSTLAALKAMLTKMPPRLFGTYDHIRRDREFIGMDDSELTDLLSAGRKGIRRSRQATRRNGFFPSSPRGLDRSLNLAIRVNGLRTIHRVGVTPVQGGSR